jgi:glutamate-1-semialdehyde 2,1-aminomutase
MGSRLAEGLRGVFADAHLPYTVVHLGSMVDFMFRPGEAHRTYSQARDSDASAYAQFYWAMLARGIFLAPSQMEVMFLTAAHTVEDVETTIEAARRSLSAAL